VTRVGLALLTGGLLAVAVAYLLTGVGVATAAGPWVLAVGTVAVVAGLAVLGLPRRRARPTVLLGAVVVVVVSVLAGFLVPLALPMETAAALRAGLPCPTAWLVGLVYLVPLVVLPVAYAVAFPHEVLRPDEGGTGPDRSEPVA
jgi:predicted lysophospholipase L1 biosynthesis ABC-type transport system permease subunit